MLLWNSSRALSALVVAQAVAAALAPVAVVVALGVAVGDVPAAIEHGLGSPSGTRLVVALVVAALVYAFSLVLDPMAGALGTAARARVTGGLQGRLLAAVCGPVGVAHLEDGETLDRLARAEGGLTGFFPGDAPVTWTGVLATRVSGLLGCLAIAVEFRWWVGLMLALVWLAVRRVMLAGVVRQATEVRGQTATMRRAWYFLAVGSKARDAKEVRVFGLGEFVGDRFRTGYLDSIRAGSPSLRRLHLRALACWIAVLAGNAVALLAIALAAHHRSIDLRTLVILIPMLSVAQSTGSVSFSDITLAWTLAALPDVDRLESDLGGDQDQLAGQRPVVGRPHESVRFEAVSFRYPAGATDVLHELDLELVAGESTALVGVNGAGKSTLVSLLSRLRDPTAGTIRVDGVDLRDLDPAGWQRRVALMPQEPVHYPFSAYDNIALGALEHRADRDGVEDCARRSGFADVVPELPHGWDTVLTRDLPGGVDLSGGQWQRLALARALFATRHGARLLVLDEPTAALDVRSEAQFYSGFLELTEGLTTLVISHRFATVRRASTICVLDGGRITERGTHEELVALGGSYAEAYRLQAERFAAKRGRR